MPTLTLSTKGLEALDDAVEAVSSGIFILRGHRDTVDALDASALVDLAARLESQSTALLGLLRGIEGKIVPKGLVTGTVRGLFYQASVQKVVSHPLDEKKAREFLGREVYRVEREEETIVVRYKVKE